MADQTSGSEPPPTEQATGSALGRFFGPYTVLRGNRSLTLLFLGKSLSACTDWQYVMALSILAYNLTHSPDVVALITFTCLLPYALLVPVSGMLADRLDRRALMVGATAGRALCFLGLIAVQSEAMLPVALLLELVSTILTSLFRPALLASLPVLVEERELLQANSIFGQVDMVALGAGPAVAGLLLATVGTQATFLVAAIGMAAAAVSIAAVSFPERRHWATNGEAGRAAEVLAGFRLLLHQDERVLMGLLLALAGTGLANGAWWTLTTILAEQTLHIGGLGLGFLNAAYALGGFATGLFVGEVVLRRSMARLFLVGAALGSLGLAGLGLSPAGVLPFAFAFLIGLADVVTKVIATTAIQTATPSSSLGKVFGAMESGLMASMVLGSVVAGPLIAAVGARAAATVLSEAGLVLLLIALPLLLRLDRVLGMRLFLRQVPILSAVPALVLDDLAASLKPVRLGGGQTLVREGDPGDRLYLIKRGRFGVFASRPDGGVIQIDTLGVRDHVGETALLRDVPRTATVSSVGTAEVYSLDRAAFEEVLHRSDDLERAMRAGSDYRLARRSTLVACLPCGPLGLGSALSALPGTLTEM